LSDIRAEELMDDLKNADKDLFIKFRDSKISLDQLRARIAERRFNVRYVTLDDVKPKLAPEILEGLDEYEPIFKMLYGEGEVPVQEVLKPLAPHEANKRCLKSLRFKPLPKKAKQSLCFTA